MYENYLSNSNHPAPRAKDVAMRARQQEKEMALLNAELKAEFAQGHGRSTNVFTGMVYALLSIFGLN